MYCVSAGNTLVNAMMVLMTEAVLMTQVMLMTALGGINDRGGVIDRSGVNDRGGVLDRGLRGGVNDRSGGGSDDDVDHDEKTTIIICRFKLYNFRISFVIESLY